MNEFELIELQYAAKHVFNYPQNNGIVTGHNAS